MAYIRMPLAKETRESLPQELATFYKKEAV
jgi:hypothetical protein